VRGAFSLGRYELPVAIGALAWLVVALFALAVPPAAKTPDLIVLGLLVLGGLFFLVMLILRRKSLDAEPSPEPGAAL